MKKILAYIVLLLLGAAIVVSSDERLMKKVSAYKYRTGSLLGSDKYKYGDLYGFSYLTKYKIHSNADSFVVKTFRPEVKRHVNLCLVHDSYLGTAFLHDREQLSGVDTIYDIEYPWWRGRERPFVTLNPSGKNVLLFELTERHLALLDTSMAFSLVKVVLVGSHLAAASESGLGTGSESESVPENKVEGGRFVFHINNNLDFVLLNSRILTPLKELKASLNLNVFKRPDTAVFVSDNGEYLLLSATRAPAQNPLADSTVKNYVLQLNKIYDHFRRSGFDEVYFSIIPSPVSVLRPDSVKYNLLIPRLQKDPELQMPMIDIYSVFSRTGYKIFQNSDTHWNSNGFQLWANELNRVLNE